MRTYELMLHRAAVQPAIAKNFEEWDDWFQIRLSESGSNAQATRWIGWAYS